jgi:hypothetical protein
MSHLVRVEVPVLERFLPMAPSKIVVAGLVLILLSPLHRKCLCFQGRRGTGRQANVTVKANSIKDV